MPRRSGTSAPGLGSARGAAPKIVVASDATGHTAEVVVRAALAQFRGAEVQLLLRSHIRRAEDVRETVREASGVSGLIVHTLVSQEMRSLMLTEARAKHVPTIDLLGPLLLRLEDLLALQPLAKPGLFRDMDAEYRRRFDVMDFTVRHDDGQDPQGLVRADLVLVGVSRSSKTPLSMFLAWRGLRVANVPIVHGLPLPEELTRVAPQRIVGLTIKPERLLEQIGRAHV
jgi:regulator of PEP synthase PpsR (kinase-PPPase family)